MDQPTLEKPGMFAWLMRKWLTQRRLAQVCTIIFFISLVPLAVAALYNYPADDDFGYTLPAATAWVQTHSPVAVLQAIVEKTKTIYQTWQGDFISSAFFTLNPLIVDIRLYFLGNWSILALLCLSAGYLIKSITNVHMKAPRSVFWIVYTLIMILMIQFMPSIAESVYWFNGGQYTVTECFLMLTIGLLFRSGRGPTRRRDVARMMMVCLCGFILGGSFFGPALGALVILFFAVLLGWIGHKRMRWYATAALLFFCVAFAISITAPGNLIRQARTGETMRALQAVLHSMLDSFDLTGQWLTPQLFAVMMLVVPVLWKPLRESRYLFRYPLGVALALYGMYAASLTPGLYTGFGYTTARYLNAIYINFLIMIFGSVLYVEGSLIRWLEKNGNAVAMGSVWAGRRFCAFYLAVSLALFTLGGFASTIMNRPSINATKILVTGEAAQFHREMLERQAFILATNSDDTVIKPLSVDISLFKHDRLPFQGTYGRLRYMKWYFELFEGKP